MRINSINQITKLIIILILLILFITRSVNACLCSPQESKVEFDRSSIVFEGKVVEINQLSFDSKINRIISFGMMLLGRDEIEAKIEVNEVWKGPIPQNIYLNTGGRCGNSLRLNERFIVFANLSSTGIISSNGCYTIRPTEKNEADLIAFGKGYKPHLFPFRYEVFIIFLFVFISLTIITYYKWKSFVKLLKLN